MKVVTLGRSSSNNVKIDDPYVGRHHCQIVQHDNGAYSVVDMNSTNGTFVNGTRIFGEAPLRPGDTLRIGHTNVPWMNYFASVPKPPKKKALPIVLGSVGGVLLLVVLLLLFFKTGSNKSFPFKGEYPNAVIVDLVDEDGTPYSVEAIEGQVCVWFEDGVSHKTSKSIIETSGGAIVAQIPDNGYYLAEVPADKVQLFLDRITVRPEVDWACPNIVSYPSKANTFVLDNFNSSDDDVSHGTMVQYALQECGTESALKSYNIGNRNGKNMSNNAQAFAMDSISKISEKGLIIINMSFGPYLSKRNNDKKYYWDEATKKEKSDYRESYLKTIKTIIKNAKKLKDKDYIIVKSAGNNGVKEFDAAIISYLRNKLEPDELEIMDKHFVIVTAGEDDRVNEHYLLMKEYEQRYMKAISVNDEKSAKAYKEWMDYENRLYNFYGRYSNEMEDGHYDPWVTKVDISDFEFAGKERAGTSFAAPRAACILSKVANDRNLTGAEVLKYAREATLKSEEHKLSYESLNNVIMESKPVVSNPTPPSKPTPPSTPAPTPKPTPAPAPKPTPTPTPSSGLSAEQVARRLGAAMAIGDVSTIRSYTTSDFFNEIMETLDVDMALLDEGTKQRAKKSFEEMPAETIKTGANTVIVRFTKDKVPFDLYLKDQNGWKCFDYAKGGVHVPKSMRKQMRDNGY